MVALILVAFTFQGFVAQTHIHRLGGISTASSSLQIETKRTVPPDKFPANQDPSNCPICQELLHSGSFITPSAVAALLPSLAVSIVAIVLDSAIAPPATSHSWRGRAPPRS